MHKKAQHEMIGFILIIVIVVVIGLFLLIFYLRQEPPKHEDIDVSNFLQSSMEYTTDCAIVYEPEYDSIEDLIGSCDNNRNCIDGRSACSALNSTLSDIIQAGWMVSEERPVNAFSVFIYYQEENRKEDILVLQKGNCTGSRTGAEHLLHRYPGNIAVDVEICYT